MRVALVEWILESHRVGQQRLVWLVVTCGLLTACSPTLVETERVKNPSGSLDAVIGERQTDATAATPTEVFIVKSGDSIAGEPFFRADHVSGMRATWNSDRDLLLHAEAARVFLYSPKVLLANEESQAVTVKLDVTKLECPHLCAVRSVISRSSAKALIRLMRDRHREGPPSAHPDGHPQASAAPPRASNQRQSSSSAASRSMSVVSASAWQPIISDEGNGQGLARVIGDAPDPHAGLLPHLAPHRLLDRLARLQEIRPAPNTCPARKRGCRPSRQRSPSMASMMTTGSTRGKNLVAAGRTDAAAATALHFGRAAAAPAEPVGVVPEEIRARLRERRKLALRYRARLSQASGDR